MSMADSKYAQLYLHPNGPGDARPTALDMVREHGVQKQLSGKVIMFTGCSSGLGIATASALAETGATLYLTARNLNKARDALSDILDQYPDRMHLLQLELDSFQSVRKCVAEVKRQSKSLNILICNAGVRHTPKGTTTDGHETQFGTNHLGHFLLFQLLKDTLISSSIPDFQSRVVFVSSGAHRVWPLDFSDLQFQHTPYDPVKAYSYSKLANVYTANEIERRFSGQGLHAWSLHPGGIRTQLNQTGLNRESISDLMMAVRLGIMNVKRNLMSPEQGAATTVWAAVGKDLEGRGGKYLERCAISQPVKEGFDVKRDGLEPGHGLWAYDETDAKRLWEVSMKLVGLSETL